MKVADTIISPNNFADVMGVSRATVRSWIDSGNMSSKYKQIGNAVPVNLAYAVGRSIVRLLNQIHTLEKNV